MTLAVILVLGLAALGTWAWVAHGLLGLLRAQEARRDPSALLEARIRKLEENTSALTLALTARNPGFRR